ncbi:MAG: HD domain-containing protein [Candidatus Hodarchaeales archaeon]|jgi:(p)ppGpp synthase/HD superfamily hydrolase
MQKKRSITVQAFEFAFLHHAGSTRKGTQIPYIVHTMDVAAILLKNCASEDMIAAGLLHDVIEEEKVKLQELENRFGRKIAQLVSFATEPEELRKGESRKTWEKRKQHTLNHLETATQEEKLFSCADKLANIRDMIINHKQLGNKLWERFNAPYEKQRWYYRSLCEAYVKGEGIGNYPAYKQFKECVEQLFT